MPDGTFFTSTPCCGVRHTLGSLVDESTAAHLGEELGDLFGLHSRRHHDITALLPVGRCRDAVLGRQLQRVDHAEDLVEVAASGGWVENGELELLVGADDEHSAGGSGHPGRVALVGIKHAKSDGKVALCVSDDGVRELSSTGASHALISGVD